MSSPRPFSSRGETAPVVPYDPNGSLSCPPTGNLCSVQEPWSGPGGGAWGAWQLPHLAPTEACILLAPGELSRKPWSPRSKSLFPLL